MRVIDSYGKLWKVMESYGELLSYKITLVNNNSYDLNS